MLTTITLLTSFQYLKQGKEKEVWLKDLKYGIFGLGNRQYEHFNKVNAQNCMLLLFGSWLLLSVFVIDYARVKCRLQRW